MKLASLRTLTWGTVSAAVGSALLLAATSPDMLPAAPAATRLQAPGAGRAPAGSAGLSVPTDIVHNTAAGGGAPAQP